jgi:hypothetical protein
MAYCTKTDVENYLQVGIDSSLDDQITAWIASVTAWINRYTGRNFEASTQIKKYDGKGRNYLYVDDLLSLSAVWFVSNDATSDAGSLSIPTTDFHLYQDDDPNKTPYNKLSLRPLVSRSEFPYGHQNVWVHGSFGYAAAVPADIKLVAAKLVASIVNVGKNDQVGQYTEGDLSVSYVTFDKLINQDVGVKEVLNWYKEGAIDNKFSFGSMVRI